MSVCSVVGCVDPADDLQYAGEPVNRDLPICTAHGQKLANGDQWYALRAGADNDHPAVYTGIDVPPRVLAVSAARCAGSEPGILLRLTLGGEHETKDLHVLVPWEEVGVVTSVLKEP